MIERAMSEYNLLCHPFIISELSVGNLGNWHKPISALQSIGQSKLCLNLKCSAVSMRQRIQLHTARIPNLGDSLSNFQRVDR